MKKYRNHIEENHNILLGKPVLKGTRIGVEIILRKLSQGASFEDIKSMYPDVTKDEISACLEYAADIVANEEALV
ncbi:DUF433 domain-containing protein [Lacihabitans sp. CCS-44]|uniref:DUF433 domain-containing protein n=1 Tax=Lacihabitans sp. CCS-44 TaxID=2487331 RepID=UPI0020CF2036|nr:DUF433 domain-containing protein [Lacihabitans sp. CCS-44]MCP9753867.1 DUF433 domain-containing protein [Lacihabitans sp. CCS-44]